MDRIETQLAIHAPLPHVYEAITHIENIPLYAPGIDEATELSAKAPDAAAGLLDLVTRSGRHIEGRVVEHEPNRTWVLQDENGTVARWGLEETREGTLATYILEGEFDPAQERALRSEMRAKIARLVLDLEAELR